MKEARLALPQLGLIAATRGMLGAGAALLLGDRLDRDTRKTIGWTLFLMGAVSTIPLAMQVFRGRRRSDICDTSSAPAEQGMDSLRSEAVV